jgi:hypothetical protein
MNKCNEQVQPIFSSGLPGQPPQRGVTVPPHPHSSSQTREFVNEQIISSNKGKKFEFSIQKLSNLLSFALLFRQRREVPSPLSSKETWEGRAGAVRRRLLTVSSNHRHSTTQPIDKKKQALDVVPFRLLKVKYQNYCRENHP